MAHAKLLVVMKPGNLGVTVRNFIPHGGMDLLAGILAGVDMRLEGPQLLQVSGTVFG